MTKRDFFILVIKLFGLFSVVTTLFSGLPHSISFALRGIDALSILWIVVSAVVVIGLFVVLVFKADKVVRLLKLDKGFDDDRIDVGGLKSTDIIKIGTFIIGGILILNNIPTFLSHSLVEYKRDLIGFQYNMQHKFDWVVSGLNLIIGFFLLTNYEFVAKRLKTDTMEEE